MVDAVPELSLAVGRVREFVPGAERDVAANRERTTALPERATD